MKLTACSWAIIAFCLYTTTAYGFDLTPNEFLPSAGTWSDGADWELGHSPIATEVAIIGGGQECEVDVTPQSPVGAVQIAAHIVDGEDVNKTILNIDGANLTVLGDSTIDGTLHLEWNASLLVGADLTITGSGDIQLDWNENEQDGADITYPNPQSDESVLTLEDECSAQQSPCNQSDLQDDCAIVLHGAGFVTAEINNNAIVSANTCQTIESTSLPEGLKLIGREKYGCGIWRAENGATLNVRTEVRGGGKWIVDGPWGGDCKTTIRIEECLLNLTGPVQVIEGQLLVEETFCTSGHLTWVPGAGESSAIEVSDGASAFFHSPGCTTMLCP